MTLGNALYNRPIRPTSLSNRIFLACTLLVTASLGLAFAYVTARASREAEAELRRGVLEASMLVDENRKALTETFTTLARLVADLPKLKAAVATVDPPTVQPLSDEYRRQLKADALLLTAPDGTRLGASGDELPSVLPDLNPDSSLDEVVTFLALPRGLVQIVSVPVLLDGEPPAILGRLTAGFFLDDALAAELKRLTGSEIAFGAKGQVLASSLPKGRHAQIVPLLAARDVSSITLDGEDFLAAARTLPSAMGDGAPVAIVLRSRTERLRFLTTIQTGLLGALAVSIALATLVSYGVARTVARPLNAITGAMREVAATGDLSRRRTLRSGRWDDADARVLASTFNTLTESIARFQSEVGQKERLSALGRLSTVIAHEIRNPLMIIKASLLGLHERASAAERQEAITDIEEETNRLNRIVTDVLDFAKPIQFDLADADLNEVCETSAAAAWAGDFSRDLALDLDPALPPVRVDAERLRMALINLLANARNAVNGAAPPAITLRTGRADQRAVITIADRGIGISAEDLPHIFDPYFTTRRAGTGLGLPIARNIIEGLHGSIAVTSTAGAGTEIRVELPLSRT